MGLSSSIHFTSTSTPGNKPCIILRLVTSNILCVVVGVDYLSYEGSQSVSSAIPSWPRSNILWMCRLTDRISVKYPVPRSGRSSLCYPICWCIRGVVSIWMLFSITSASVGSISLCTTCQSSEMYACSARYTWLCSVVVSCCFLMSQPLAPSWLY